MSTASTVDRTLRSPGKCRAITRSKGIQCDKSPYTGEGQTNSRFCYAHRTPQSRKLGEVDDKVDDPITQVQTYPQVIVPVKNTNRSQAYHPSATENVEDKNHSQAYHSSAAEEAYHPSAAEEAYHTSATEEAYHPSATENVEDTNRSQAYRPSATEEDATMFNQQPPPSQFAFNQQPRSPPQQSQSQSQSQTDTPFVFNQQPRSTPSLEAVMAQLTRMELQSREDVRRIDINYKAKVEDLETRVQNLERTAQIPGHIPVDPISSNDVSRIVSLFEEHLNDVQHQHNINYEKRNDAKARAAILYRKGEAAHRAYGVALQKYHEKEQEFSLRNQQAQHLKGLEQRIRTRIDSLRGMEPREPGRERGPDNMEDEIS